MTLRLWRFGHLLPRSDRVLAVSSLTELGRSASEAHGFRSWQWSSALDIFSRHFFTEERQEDEDKRWSILAESYPINPCASPFHPAVKSGLAPTGAQTSLQEAYTPYSKCYGCGPQNPEGMQLRSHREKDGLSARINFAKRFEAFPGIVQGGAIGSVLECHGNWTAAIALMDRGCLPKPPLTLTYSILITYKEPTPAGAELQLRSQVVRVCDNPSMPGLGKASVEVNMQLLRPSADADEPGKVLVAATGIFKRAGALRAF